MEISLIKPIRLLLSGVEQVNNNNLDIKVPIEFEDEIGIVTKAFNKMVYSIKTSKLQLESYTENLENMVTDRTIDLQKALEDLKKAQTKLIENEKLASLGSLIAGLAHEINTPLGVSLTAASYLDKETATINNLIKNGDLRKEQLNKYLSICIDSAQIILSNLNRSTELIQYFKKVSSDYSSENEKVFNLEGVILNTIQILKTKTINRVAINLNCDKTIEIKSYPLTITQIIQSLIENSLNHAFDNQIDAEINIDVIKSDNELTIRYSDNGTGITDNNIKKIFEPFYTTKRNKGHIGLGLHIVHNLVVHSLNGVIDAHNLNNGFEVVITFPVNFQ